MVFINKIPQPVPKSRGFALEFKAVALLFVLPRAGSRVPGGIGCGRYLDDVRLRPTLYRKPKDILLRWPVGYVYARSSPQLDRTRGDEYSTEKIRCEAQSCG